MILAPMATFGAIGSASAAPYRPAAVHAAPAAGTTIVKEDVCYEFAGVCDKVVLNPGPRIGCGGANAVIEWMGINLQSYGEAWDNCGSGTYVQIFLSWTSPTGHNVAIATAGPYSTVGFNTGDVTGLTFIGNISITACEHDNGWHCGTPIPIHV